MGYKVDPSFISPGVNQPFEKITWETLNGALTDPVKQTLIGLIGANYDPNAVYVIWGCGVTIGGSVTTIGAGAVFAQGEVFYINGPLTVTNPTGGNVIVANMQSIFTDTDSGSGTLFSDGFYHQIHSVRICNFSSAGASGTGNLNGIVSAANDLASFMRIYSQDRAIEIRSSSSGDTITFEKNRIIQYTSTMTGTINIDVTNAVVGNEIIFYGSILSGVTINFTAGAVNINLIYNVGSITASANRQTFRIKCVGYDAAALLSSPAGFVFTISDLNNA